MFARFRPSGDPAALAVLFDDDGLTMLMHQVSLELGCLALLATVAASQVSPPVHVTRLTRLDPYTRYSGVWGYTAPDGRDFALVGDLDGLWIVETTDPANPRQVGYFAAPASRWREITSHGPFVYSVSEHHAGMRVIDMSNPSSPVDRGYVEQARWSSAHSISVDPDRGHVYVNGTASGMHVFDVAANPTQPPRLAAFTLEYVHDAIIRRGTAYLSEINRGYLRILDVRNLGSINQPAATIARFRTDGAFTHSAWVSEDDALLIVTDENQWGRLRAWDIQTPAQPRKLGDYGTNGHIVHNLLMTGRTGYIAHNSEGFHMVDLADPSQIDKIASYDTSGHGANTGYTGAWGCYPFADHGAIYVSDREEGLMVLQVEVGHLNRFGSATPNAAGQVPRARADGATARVGAANFGLVVDGLAPHAAFAVVLGARASPYRVLGIDVHLDPRTLVAIDGRADQHGRARVALPVPGKPALALGRVHAQVVAVDAGGPSGLTASRGMWFGIAPR